VQFFCDGLPERTTAQHARHSWDMDFGILVLLGVLKELVGSPLLGRSKQIREIASFRRREVCCGPGIRTLKLRVADATARVPLSPLAGSE